MSEQTNMEEAINQFVKSLEEEQKYDKLIEVSKNAKTASEEANLAKNIENTTDLTSEDSYKKIEKFILERGYYICMEIIWEVPL